MIHTARLKSYLDFTELGVPLRMGYSTGLARASDWFKNSGVGSFDIMRPYRPPLLLQLNPSTTDQAPVHNRTVATIPDDLPLTDAESSVLSKGLTFVPVNNKPDEYEVKADCERHFIHSTFS